MSRPPCSINLPRDQAEALDSALGRVIDEYNDDLKDSIFDDEEKAEKAEQLAKVEAARLTLTQTLRPAANPKPVLFPTTTPAQQRAAAELLHALTRVMNWWASTPDFAHGEDEMPADLFDAAQRAIRNGKDTGIPEAPATGA